MVELRVNSEEGELLLATELSLTRSKQLVEAGFTIAQRYVNHSHLRITQPLAANPDPFLGWGCEDIRDIPINALVQRYANRI